MMNKGHLIILFLSALVIISSFSIEGSAQKSAKMQSLERQRKAMMKEISQTEAELKKTTSSAESGLKRLKLITKQINTRKAMIESLGKEIEATDEMIGVMNTQIDSLTILFDNHQGNYVKSLQAMQHKRNTHEQLLFILSAKDFEQGIRRARYLKEYADWQKGEAIKLKSLKAELDNKKEQLTAQRTEKLALMNTREQERTKLQNDEAQSKKELAALQSQKKQLEQHLAKQRRQAAALNKQIEQQIAKEIAEAEAKARRERELAAKQNKKSGSKSTTTATRKAAVKGGYAMTTEEYKLSNNFESNRGKLPMPISGPFRIVSTFGEHSHELLTHVRVNNSGIDIQGQSGAEALAVFNGVVSRIFVVEGYNNSIIVRHGNYLTVYSNLTSVYVSAGQKVTTGQALGKIYHDADEGGPRLHFQVWKERTKLNPQLWLRR